MIKNNNNPIREEKNEYKIYQGAKRFEKNAQIFEKRLFKHDILWYNANR